VRGIVVRGESCRKILYNTHEDPGYRTTKWIVVVDDNDCHAGDSVLDTGLHKVYCDCWLLVVLIGSYLLVCAGVPREKRGDIWLLLIEQHRLHHNVSAEATEAEVSEKYEDLLKRLTLHQHAILIDLGQCICQPYCTAIMYILKVICNDFVPI